MYQQIEQKILNTLNFFGGGGLTFFIADKDVLA